MRLRRARALLGMDGLELLATRSFWLLLLVIGPLVGHAFITSVNLYAEASGGGGGPAALAQGLTPLDGIFVPTFGAYDLAITLLFPFVAISLVSFGKESGALGLLLQTPFRPAGILGSKAAVLLLGWCVAFLPGLLSVALWLSYGGHVYWPELGGLLFGHLLVSFSHAAWRWRRRRLPETQRAPPLRPSPSLWGPGCWISWRRHAAGFWRRPEIHPHGRTARFRTRAPSHGRGAALCRARRMRARRGVAAPGPIPARTVAAECRGRCRPRLCDLGRLASEVFVGSQRKSPELVFARGRSRAVANHGASHRHRVPRGWRSPADGSLPERAREAPPGDARRRSALRRRTGADSSRDRETTTVRSGTSSPERRPSAAPRRRRSCSRRSTALPAWRAQIAPRNEPTPGILRREAERRGLASLSGWPVLVVMAWGTTRYFFLEGNNRRRIPEGSHSWRKVFAVVVLLFSAGFSLSCLFPFSRLR